MAFDGLERVLFDVNENIFLNYKSGSQMLFVRDDAWLTNLVLIYSSEKLEAASYRLGEYGNYAFWSAGKVNQAEFLDYWNQGIFYTDFLSNQNFLNLISDAQWDLEGFGDICETILGDPVRLIHLSKSSLEVVKELPENLTYCLNMPFNDF